MEKADIGLIGLGVMGQNLYESCQQGMEGCSMEPYRSWKKENVVEHFISQPRQRKRHHRQ